MCAEICHAMNSQGAFLHGLPVTTQNLGPFEFRAETRKHHTHRLNQRLHNDSGIYQLKPTCIQNPNLINKCNIVR